MDGILACTNTRGDIWNVFGGLSRTKKAVAGILTNELRDNCVTSTLSDTGEDRDAIMVGCLKSP